MSEHAYDALAEVYEWLVPDTLLTPAGNVAAFAGTVVDLLEPGARVLDCAAGTGQLAVGLALQGFDVVATDASPAMVERTRRLAGDDGAVTTHGERLPFWPFTHAELDEDLRAAGLAPASTTYTPEAERYMVTATRHSGQDLA